MINDSGLVAYFSFSLTCTSMFFFPCPIKIVRQLPVAILSNSGYVIIIISLAAEKLMPEGSKQRWGRKHSLK